MFSNTFSNDLYHPSTLVADTTVLLLESLDQDMAVVHCALGKRV